MRSCTLVLVAALWGCATDSGALGERSRDGGIVLIASDTLIYASDSEDADLAANVDNILDAMDAAIANRQVTLRRYAREPAGLVPVPDTAATPTDFGVLVDPSGRVIGAVVGEPPFSTGARFTTYVFDEQGRTIGLEVAFTDQENGCGELLHVELRWFLRDGNVVQYSRRLIDEDGYGVSIDECVVGAGEQRNVLGTWAELARSVGMDRASPEWIRLISSSATLRRPT